MCLAHGTIGVGQRERRDLTSPDLSNRRHTRPPVERGGSRVVSQTRQELPHRLARESPVNCGQASTRLNGESSDGVILSVIVERQHTGATLDERDGVAQGAPQRAALTQALAGPCGPENSHACFRTPGRARLTASHVRDRGWIKREPWSAGAVCVSLY